LFGYDEADNIISLKTFRTGTETVSADPSGRTDGDTTTWSYHDATGLETRKTCADGSHLDKTYDDYNRLSQETLARGITKTHSYEHARGLLLGTAYSDGTTARSYQYNHLGQLTQVVDDAGTRTIGYNTYGEQETDRLTANSVTHLITETRDDMGRSTGYTYAKNGATQQTVTTGYGTDGRISTAGFLHQGAEKQFGYSYLPGTNLLQTLTMPCNMTLTQSYETQRDLLIGMAYKRGTTGVAERAYAYDVLGRPLTRRTARKGATVNDTFGYSNRSELTEATVSGASYSYAYDNISNRKSAQEAAEEATAYTANALNQYTAIQQGTEEAFVPTYDADGNQTQVKTSTGIWTVAYNAENRPITFTNNESNTVIECVYDYMGRRSIKKVTANGTVTLHQRYLYRGYLQIACCDLTRDNHPCLWLITWDPTQPVATRPLAIQKSGTWYCYGWDLTKNSCEVFGSNGYINTIYTYTPYGEVTSSGSTAQPFQWSSEFCDSELGLVYYCKRHYNPFDGRWINRDAFNGLHRKNLYLFVNNNSINGFDYNGEVWPILAIIGRAIIKGALSAVESYGEQVFDNYVKGVESPWTEVDGYEILEAGISGMAGGPNAHQTYKNYKKFRKASKEAKELHGRLQKCQKIDTARPLTPHNKKLLRKQTELRRDLKTNERQQMEALRDEIENRLDPKDLYKDAIKDFQEKERQNRGNSNECIIEYYDVYEIEIIIIIHIEEHPVHPVYPIYYDNDGYYN